MNLAKSGTKTFALKDGDHCDNSFLAGVTAWSNGYNSIYLKNRYHCIGHKYGIQNTAK